MIFVSLWLKFFKTFSFYRLERFRLKDCRNDAEVAEIDAEVAGNDTEVAGNDAEVTGIASEVAGNDAEVAGNVVEVAGNDVEVNGDDEKVKYFYTLSRVTTLSYASVVTERLRITF